MNLSNSICFCLCLSVCIKCWSHIWYTFYMLDSYFEHWKSKKSHERFGYYAKSCSGLSGPVLTLSITGFDTIHSNWSQTTTKERKKKKTDHTLWRERMLKVFETLIGRQKWRLETKPTNHRLTRFIGKKESNDANYTQLKQWNTEKEKFHRWPELQNHSVFRW